MIPRKATMPINSKLLRGSNVFNKSLPINKTTMEEKRGIVTGDIISFILIFKTAITFRIVTILKHNVVKSMAKAAPFIPFNGTKIAIKMDKRAKLIKPNLNWVFDFPRAFNI